MTDEEKEKERLAHIRYYREDYSEWATESHYWMANDLKKALANNDLETAMQITLKLIEDIEGDQRLDFFNELETLMFYVIMWTQARRDQREGEWMTAIDRQRHKVAYLQVEQPKFDEEYLRKEVAEVYEYAAQRVTHTELEPFGIRRPTWEQLFVDDYSWND